MSVQVPTPPEKTPFVMAGFYKFVSLPDFEELQEPLQKLCMAQSLRGTILLAEEGINGTLSGAAKNIQAFWDSFAATPEFADITPKFGFCATHAFNRMKVRLKREIVTIGRDTDPTATGTYIAPQDWNALISDPDVLVIDARNQYEVAIGSFAGAIDPQTDSFGELPAKLDALAAQKPKKIAMFCTGGIRCEKASAYLVGQGVENVFQLEGGILKYLEQVPQEESLWQGDCFVFDRRVSVRHGFAQGYEEGDYEVCHACRMPLAPEDKTHADFEAGVACHHCIGHHSEADRRRFRERRKQLALAHARAECD